MILDQHIVREFLRYFKTTGRFVWRYRARDHFLTDKACNAWNARYPGETAGTFHRSSGYWIITINNCPHGAHRLAWLWVHGWLPKELDHVNQDRIDNRICNLREVSHRDNGRNRRLSRNNTSSISGVSWSSKEQKWRATIRVNYKHLNIGVFSSLDAAARARKSAERKYGFHRNHGR